MNPKSFIIHLSRPQGEYFVYWFVVHSKVSSYVGYKIIIILFIYIGWIYNPNVKAYDFLP